MTNTGIWLHLDLWSTGKKLQKRLFFTIKKCVVLLALLHNDGKGEMINMYIGSKKISPNAFHMGYFFFFLERIAPRSPLVLGFMCSVVICVPSTLLSL